MCSCSLLLQPVLSDRVVSPRGMSNVSTRTDLHSSAWTQSFIKASISTLPSRHLHTHSITGFHTRSYWLPLLLSGTNSLISCTTFVCYISVHVMHIIQWAHTIHLFKDIHPEINVLSSFSHPMSFQPIMNCFWETQKKIFHWWFSTIFSLYGQKQLEHFS